MKKVIIVGATSGLGFELTKLFIKQNWVVGIAGRREDRLIEISKNYPNNIVYEQIDVTDEKAPSLLLKLIKKLGGMDIYIHSSGVGYQNLDLSLEIDNKTTQTNVYGFTQMLNTAFHYYKDFNKSGQIAIISSVAGTKGIGIAATYSATKRYQSTYLDALEQLSNTLDIDIKFTDIKPGFIKTDLLNNSSEYPLIMKPEYASKLILSAILNKRRRAIVNWKFRLLIGLWKLVPAFIWKRIKLTDKVN